MTQLSDIIPANAQLEKVFDGCAFSEGPAADAEGRAGSGRRGGSGERWPRQARNLP